MAKPKIPKDDAAGWRKEANKLRKALEELTTSVAQCVASLDAVMTRPASLDRGKAISKITNFMELRNDIARRFALGEKFPLKRPTV